LSKSINTISAEQLKEMLTRECIVSLLEQLGYAISTRDFKFRLRDEKTPSAIINKDGTIHDYGADFHGDIFNVLQEFHNLTFKEALEYIKVYLGITENTIIEPRASIVQKKDTYAPNSDDIEKDKARLQEIAKNISYFDSFKQYQSFSHLDYKREALAIAPLWLFSQASKQSLDKFKSATTFDFKHKTLIIKIHNYSQQLISYKRRRVGAGKWITAKNTHPNKQCLINIKANHTPIYVVEGVHDYLTALLLDYDDTYSFNVLMIQTVNYKQFTEYELSLLKDREVCFIPDLDDKNMKGVECMQNLAEQLNCVAKEISIIDLKKFLESENIKYAKSKIDLSDCVECWADGARTFVSALEHYKDIY